MSPTANPASQPAAKQAFFIPRIEVGYLRLSTREHLCVALPVQCPDERLRWQMHALLSARTGTNTIARYAQ